MNAHYKTILLIAFIFLAFSRGFVLPYFGTPVFTAPSAHADGPIFDVGGSAGIVGAPIVDVGGSAGIVGTPIFDVGGSAGIVTAPIIDVGGSAGIVVTPIPEVPVTVIPPVVTPPVVVAPVITVAPTPPTPPVVTPPVVTPPATTTPPTNPNAPVCTLASAPSTVNAGSTATLTWTTTNAVSFSIDQTVGLVTPVTAGSTTTPQINADTTFTGTATSASGATVVCTATVRISTGGGGGCTSNCGGGGGGGGGGGTPSPNVLLSALPHVTSQPLASAAFLYLSQIPYTGLDLGPLGTALYWTALIGWALALAYLVLFGAVPVMNRSAREFGARVAGVLNNQSSAAVMPLPLPVPAPAPKRSVMESSVPEASRTHSTYEGFKSFAQNGALSIEDIVKGLSRTPAKVEPIYENVEPVYEHVEPINERVEPIAAPARREASGAVPAHVRGFTAALLEGDRAAVFAGLRQQIRGGEAPELLITSTVCLLDDAYRARVDGTNCDADIARMTARLDTPTFEKLISALTTGIDASYSAGVTGAKLALTRALAVLGA